MTDTTQLAGVRYQRAVALSAGDEVGQLGADSAVLASRVVPAGRRGCAGIPVTLDTESGTWPSRQLPVPGPLGDRASRKRAG